jgi:16S rRNA processing protein RimM
MGRLAAPFGVKGWLKVRTFTQQADALADFETVWLKLPEGWQAFTLDEVALGQKGLTVRFAGIEDRTHAQRLTGCEIAVARAKLPPPEVGEFYWADLVGLAALTRSGERLGEIAGLLESGANDVLIVRGEREHLIPAAMIVEVDMAAGHVTLDWAADY